MRRRVSVYVLLTSSTCVVFCLWHSLLTARLAVFSSPQLRATGTVTSRQLVGLHAPLHRQLAADNDNSSTTAGSADRYDYYSARLSLAPPPRRTAQDDDAALGEMKFQRRRRRQSADKVLLTWPTVNVIVNYTDNPPAHPSAQSQVAAQSAAVPPLQRARVVTSRHIPRVLHQTSDDVTVPRQVRAISAVTC